MDWEFPFGEWYPAEGPRSDWRIIQYFNPKVYSVEDSETGDLIGKPGGVLIGIRLWPGDPELGCEVLLKPIDEEYRDADLRIAPDDHNIGGKGVVRQIRKLLEDFVREFQGSRRRDEEVEEVLDWLVLRLMYEYFFVSTDEPNN